ncbi:MAG: PKD domain-containing protein, partial [Bacteroidia bacterium]|nr:PKD domain-containing protein [Bacteroidia bacterium]
MRTSSFIAGLVMLMGLMMGVNTLQASHYMGVDITYECINNCTYRIYHTTYYDCSGAAMQGFIPPNPNNPPPDPNFGFDITGIPNFPGQTCAAPTALNNWTYVPGSYVDVTPVCPTVLTACDGVPNAPVRGVVAVTYTRDYNFCNTNCNIYNIEWGTCCRNAAITSINGGAFGSVGIFTGNTQINTTLSPCNSSPQFGNIPTPYLCSGQSYTFNQGAFDPDGDSLVYSLGPCFDNQGVQVPYFPGFSATQPLGAGWNVTINALTGDINFTPNPGGPPVVAVVCVKVEEYRNGVKIGEVVRDIQVTVLDCNILGTPNAPPIVSALTNLTPGATANGLTVTSCACQEVCFDIETLDPDSGQTYIMYWNQNVPGTFVDVNNPLVPVDTLFSTGATPTAQFCWVPTQTGTYQFLVTLVDDGCPLLGQGQYSIVINVNSCSLDPFVDENRLSCNTFELDGYPCGGAPPFTYAWTGTGGISGNTATITHTYPGPGTYNYTLTITDSTGVSSTYSDTILVNNTAIANAGPDITLCSGQIASIGTPALPGYTYQWNSFFGLGWAGAINPASAQANVLFNNGTTVPFTIPFTLTATDPFGCVSFDTATVIFQPKPAAGISGPPTACVNEVITLSFAGLQIPGTVYNWDFGGGTSVGTGPGPNQVSWSTPGLKTVKLWINVNGCPSDTIAKTIQVFPIPTSGFSVTPSVCAGSSAQVVYTGSASPASATFLWDFDGGIGTGG